MAYFQSSLHAEIQNLKDALTASEKKADRYAQLIVTLSVELDDLRNNICHSCKTKLASGNTFVPSIAISADLGSTNTATLVSALQGRPCPTSDEPSISPSHSLAAPQNTNTTSLPVPSEPEAAISSQTTLMPTHPGPNIISPEQKPTKPPQWSVAYNPKVERPLELHLAHAFTLDSEVCCVHISPDGQRLAVGLSGNGKTYLYELPTGSKICVLVDLYVKDDLDIQCVQFSPDSQILATGAYFDHHIRIWDIPTKRMRAILKGHKHAVYSIAFSPNSRSLVSASADGSVRIWNIRDGSSKVLPVIGLPSYFVSVVFSPDGRFVAAGNLGYTLWIWDSRTYRLVAMWKGRMDTVWCIEFTPDGTSLICAAFNGTVKYWDVSSLGNRRGVSTGTIEEGFPEVVMFLGQDDQVLSAALFPDNTPWIVTGSNDKSVRVWDIRSGLCLLKLQGHMSRVRGVVVSRTQNFLATAGSDGHITVWKYKEL